MGKFIKTSIMVRTNLVNEFNCSMMTVREALSYRSNSYLAKKIRQAALDHGGEMLESCMCPECETIHTPTEINQIFADEVIVVISKVDSSAKILHHGKEVENFDKVCFSQWDDVLSRASEYVNRN